MEIEGRKFYIAYHSAKKVKNAGLRLSLGREGALACVAG